MEIRDFLGAESIPLPEAHGEGVPGSADFFPGPLRWLFCVSLAISIYCMAIIGILHKGLDTVNCSRVPKVSTKLNFIIS
jgi:hypothetical protein